MEERRTTEFLEMLGNRVMFQLQRLGNATTRQLSQELGDVSATSMYRVMKHLLEQGKVEILQEHKARALQERVYALANQALSLPDYGVLPRTTYLQAVASYFTGVLDGLRKYSLYSEHSPEEDGAFFLAIPAMLSREEALRLAERVTDVVAEIRDNQPGGKRNMLTVSFLISPAMYQKDPDSLTPACGSE